MVPATRRHLRTRRVLALAALAPAALLVLAVALAAVLPGRVNRATLEASVGSRVSDATQGSGYDASCRPGICARWRCVLTPTAESDTVAKYMFVLDVI